jgi:cell wall-active antibiotic response 4TMS protein YvqF
MVGVVLIAIGSLLFARELGANLPPWIFRWEMILVVVGISIGVKSGFRDFGWIAVTGIGLFFLSDDIFPNWDPSRFLFPAIILAVGAFILLQKLSPGTRDFGLGHRPPNGISGDFEDTDEARPATDASARNVRHTEVQTDVLSGEKFGNHYEATGYADPASNRDPAFTNQAPVDPELMREEELEIVSVFSAVNRKVFSKNFVGGEIVCVFGGSEVNLMNADILQGPITVEVVCVFGGATLFIPPNWNVRSQMGSVFGGVDDKRKNALPDPSKTIIVTGVCIFGGLEIKTRY